MRRKKSLQERGITLIALVVTIIILLILAGVTLNMALSQNGLFSKTQEAADKYKQAQEDEELEIEKIEYAADGKDITKVETILDKQGFKDFRDKVNNGDDFNNTLIKLSCDLDLSGDTWEPIGTPNNPFNGVFNGNDHKITNLKLDKIEDELKGKDDMYYIGLFGCNEGIIKNIGIESASVSSEIYNTYIIGMIAGYNSGIVENCYNNANITCNIAYHLGGIVGNIDIDGQVSKCYNKGNLEIKSSSGFDCQVGGIMGSCWRNGNSIISQCFNLGNITCHQKGGSNYMAAGICGTGTMKVDSCYNVGTITLENNEGENHFYPVSAGIVGQGGSVEVKNCYNIGEVIMNTNESAIGVRHGSFIGLISGKYLFENIFCYVHDGLKAIGSNYNELNSEIEKIRTFENKEDMKSIADKLGDNFKADTRGINDRYPILTWQE